jgi:dihydropteroate synthase
VNAVALPAAPREWRTARGALALNGTRIVGIVNVTPDSFFDGGRHATRDAAIARAAALVEEGADILDVGGESTRPGAHAVAAAEERARIVPVVAEPVRRWPAVPISVDTVKAEVARAALDVGAAIINDVSGLRHDAELGAVAAAYGAGIIVMHSRGSVAEMASYALADYGADAVGEIAAELGHAAGRAAAAGIAHAAIVVDPGLGFAKRTEHSVAVLAQLDRITALGYPVLIGPSRKRFVGELAGGLPPESRLEGTIAACVIGVLRGARLLRVHDVGAVRRAVAVAAAMGGAP